MTIKLYSGVAGTFRRYWSIYGGCRALLSSPYFHFSILLSLFLWPLWRTRPHELYGLIVSIVPSVLGFSLGGYAILLAFGDDKFRKAISGTDEDGKTSPFMEVNASFIHFIVVSAFALILGIVGSAWSIGCGISLLGCVALIYSIACALASAFAIFEVAGWFDIQADIEKDRTTGEE